MWWLTIMPSMAVQIAKQIIDAIDEDMPLSVLLTPAIRGVEVSFWNGAGQARPGCYFQLPKPVGITITAEVVVLSKGTLKFIQNVKCNDTRVNNDASRKECLSKSHQGQWMCDGGDPYQGKSKDVSKPGKVTFEAKDSPGQCLSDPKLEALEIDDTFRTYLLWKAKPKKRKTKGSAGWNVIGCVEWSWSGKASPTPDAVKPKVVCGVNSGGISYRWKKTAGNAQAAVIQTTDTPVSPPPANPDDWTPCK